MIEYIIDRDELLDQENRMAAERLAAKVASLKSVSYLVSLYYFFMASCGVNKWSRHVGQTLFNYLVKFDPISDPLLLRSSRPATSTLQFSLSLNSLQWILNRRHVNTIIYWMKWVVDLNQRLDF